MRTVGIKHSQGDGFVGNAVFRGALVNAVAVGVVPYQIADNGGVNVIAEVGGFVVTIACAQSHAVGGSSARSHALGFAIAVGGVVRASAVPVPGKFAVVIAHKHFVSAIGQIVEAIIAAVVRGGGGNQACAGVVPQFDGDIFKPSGFRRWRRAAIQNTVGVGVFPQCAAEFVGRRCSGFVAKILAQVDAVIAAIWISSQIDGRLTVVSAFWINRIAQAGYR